MKLVLVFTCLLIVLFSAPCVLAQDHSSHPAPPLEGASASGDEVSGSKMPGDPAGVPPNAHPDSASRHGLIRGLIDLSSGAVLMVPVVAGVNATDGPSAGADLPETPRGATMAPPVEAVP